MVRLSNTTAFRITPGTTGSPPTPGYAITWCAISSVVRWAALFRRTRLSSTHLANFIDFVNQHQLLRLGQLSSSWILSITEGSRTLSKPTQTGFATIKIGLILLTGRWILALPSPPQHPARVPSTYRGRLAQFFNSLKQNSR